MLRLLIKMEDICWLLSVLGLLSIATGLMCAFSVFPVLINWKVDKEFDLWNNKSEGYNNFVRLVLISLSHPQYHCYFCSHKLIPPVPIYMKFHFFVVTNPLEVQNGAERPVLLEQGPYSYIEYREKMNISDRADDEDTVR
jgi:hypothetical protein